MIIREVEPDKAEAVLSVRLFVPGVAEGLEDQYYLARVRPRPLKYEIESVTLNPDGSITEIGTATTEEESVVAHATHADGATAEGSGFGYGKYVSIEGWSADEVAVHVSMSWTARNRSHGKLDEELVVPWMENARRDLGGGAWLEAGIAPYHSDRPVPEI